jgi:hypothetical protein
VTPGRRAREVEILASAMESGLRRAWRNGASVDDSDLVAAAFSFALRAGLAALENSASDDDRERNRAVVEGAATELLVAFLPPKEKRQ